MKKIAFVIAMAAISTALYSQVFVGGSLGFSTSGSSTTSGNTTTDGATLTTFSLYPTVGYYLNSQMAVGVEFDLNLKRQNNNATPTTITTTSGFGISPFVRYHLVEMGPISVFGQGSVGIGFSKEKIKTGNTSTDGDKTTSFEIAVRPGISYKFTDQIGIEAFLGGLWYNMSSTKKPNDDKDKDHYLSLDLRTFLLLGFVYKF
jgi:outer membrane protein